MSFPFNNDHPNFLLNSFGDVYGNFNHVSGAPSMRAYWNKRSPGLPLLINGTGIYEYGALHLSHALDAYTIEYGALYLSYILGGIVEGTIASTAAATSVVSAICTFNSLVAASTGASESAATIQKIIDEVIAETAAATSAAIANLTLYALIESTASAVFYVRIDGQSYPVWVVNAETFAASRYTNFDFNSFGTINGRSYAANEDGLYELTGDDDAGTDIAASIILGRDRRGSAQVKRSNRVYLHGTSANKLELRVVTDQGDIYTYVTEQELSDYVTAQRVVLGRGLTAHYWQLEVRNKAGADFELEQIEVVSLHTSRKIKR